MLKKDFAKIHSGLQKTWQNARQSSIKMVSKNSSLITRIAAFFDFVFNFILQLLLIFIFPIAAYIAITIICFIVNIYLGLAALLFLFIFVIKVISLRIAYYGYN